MIDIIAHRGFWLDASEQNTEIAFIRALSNGFGIETDLRDHTEKLVISHDMPNDNSMRFDTFLQICSQYDDELTLALNVKADGLQEGLKASSIENRHFYFDMSVPDMIGYIRKDMTVYSRYSEIETSPALYSKSDGIWLDNFTDERLVIDVLEQFIQDGKKVVLVSPELHKRDESLYWQTLKTFLNSNSQWSKYIGLCTDFPSKARDYFYD
ncbi:hypothetical protein AB4277_12595 [Vibrio splendidus]|uniref:hypothetical protein n=1 Tax=Vibrio splendidus TaxID=29497 RepID=UPI0018E4D8A5|nr:hypothetical protein [Vibrio splendidus]